MSGSGTNLIKILEKERALKKSGGSSPFEMVFIFSDRSDGGCRGENIALEHGLPYFSYDIRAFHRTRGVKRTIASPEGLAARKDYDQLASNLVKAFDIDLIALGGYMSIITLSRCVNVHPADLSILSEDGQRRYTGDRAVPDAISAGESALRSSTLWADEGVDSGPLLMVSAPLPVVLPEPLEILKRDKNRFMQVADEHQERLKEIGDWKIFPRTVELISEGRFAFDEKHQVYFDGQPIEGGLRE
jgi:folate-dependent phosphoribosylglycinamide formyltransferase PurN